MGCSRHALASGPGGLCPVCLLEQALAPAVVRDLIIRVPLGHSADTSVFLVAQEAPSQALLRLKVWRRPAPAGFLEAVEELAGVLEDLGAPEIVPPLTACVDGTGCPAVLSPFKQGFPLVYAVQSGALQPAAAMALLDSLASTLRRCHTVELAHGSLVPGNVMASPEGASAFLVDFGLAPLLNGTSQDDAVAADLAGLAALAGALRRPEAHRPHVTSAGVS
jgi:serine/threonine protein kinase